MQDLIGEAKLWPKNIRKLFWKKNVKYFERFMLCLFVYINGLQQDIFIGWCELMGLLRDHAAKSHIISLFSDFDRKIMDQHQKYYSFNVTTRKYEYLNGAMVRFEKK